MSESIIRNKYGEVVHISVPAGEETEVGFAGATASQVADQFIQAHMAKIGLDQSRIDSDEIGLTDAARAEDPVITVTREKQVAGATVVVYEQSIVGLPVFNATMGVLIDDASQSVLSLQSSAHAAIQIENPDAKNGDQQSKDKSLTGASLKKKLGASLTNISNVRVQRQVVYRFEAEERMEVFEDHGEGGFDHPETVEIKLSAVPKKIKEGAHYIVNEVLFEAPLVKGESAVNWRALIEPESGAVLYVRALVAGATGMVYERDPQTQSGSSVTGASSNAALNPFRTSVTLEGLTSATPQPLSGEFVEVVDISPPAIVPPVGANPTSAFNYNVRTDHFSAVNAYYHCDNLFRTMQDYGFNIASYFGGTSFPVPVDHRGKGSAVNADAPGNSSGNGMGKLRFGLLQSGEAVGITTSNRVVWHEFGHGLLWDNVGSPNFGFAHSAGDALAAIFNDPESNEPDRGHTFPWVNEGTPISRRHDRTVAGGWGWFGPSWNTQYGGEQVLSSTLFRIYQSLGGASSNLGKRRSASELTTFLIFKGIGLLSSTTTFPEIFETALENADRTTAGFKGIPGGAVHKVIRWGFEKQGLFQPAAAPGQGNNVNTEGNPPDVDVYIDDGRNGEYPFLANHWSCQDMWVRNSADGGLAHQQPLVGLTNYMYVRVKNRGLQTANNVTVDAYHCLPGSGLSFPDDWIPMATPSLPAAGPIASGGDTIVGPFAFVPTQVGHECLLAIAHADGDAGNDTTITGTVPEHRLVPFDNNIGQRNVHPIYPTFRWLVEWLREHVLWIRNPFKKAVVCEIRIIFPKFLRKLGWELKVVSRGGAKFEMGPRDSRKIVLSVEPGEEFSPDMVKRAIAQGEHEIHIETYLDGELSGGMSYPLSYDAKPETDKPSEDDECECTCKCKDGYVKRFKLPRSVLEEILRAYAGPDRPQDLPVIERPVISQPVIERPVIRSPIRTIRFEIDLDADE